jgi:hypothetical protein
MKRRETGFPHGQILPSLKTAKHQDDGPMQVSPCIPYLCIIIGYIGAGTNIWTAWSADRELVYLTCNMGAKLLPLLQFGRKIWLPHPTVGAENPTLLAFCLGSAPLPGAPLARGDQLFCARCFDRTSRPVIYSRGPPGTETRLVLLKLCPGFAWSPSELKKRPAHGPPLVKSDLRHDQTPKGNPNSGPNQKTPKQHGERHAGDVGAQRPSPMPPIAILSLDERWLEGSPACLRTISESGLGRKC